MVGLINCIRTDILTQIEQCIKYTLRISNCQLVEVMAWSLVLPRPDGTTYLLEVNAAHSFLQGGSQVQQLCGNGNDLFAQTCFGNCHTFHRPLGYWAGGETLTTGSADFQHDSADASQQTGHYSKRFSIKTPPVVPTRESLGRNFENENPVPPPDL